MYKLKVKGKILCVDCGSDTQLFGVELQENRESYLCMDCTDKREDEEEEPVVLSANSTNDNMGATNYMYIQTDNFMEEESFKAWVHLNYERTVTAEHDCSGQWFTTSIYIKKLNDALMDYHLYSVIVESARDV